MGLGSPTNPLGKVVQKHPDVWARRTTEFGAGPLAESPGRCHSAEEQENKPRNPGRGEESAEEWLWVGAKLSEFCLLDSVFTPEGERF